MPQSKKAVKNDDIKDQKYLQLSLACPTYLQPRVSRERFAQNEGGPCQRTAITNQSQAPGGGPTLAFINVQTKLKGPVTSQSQRQRQRMELSNFSFISSIRFICSNSDNRRRYPANERAAGRPSPSTARSPKPSNADDAHLSKTSIQYVALSLSLRALHGNIGFQSEAMYIKNPN